jgi:type II secretion system protein H
MTLRTTTPKTTRVGGFTLVEMLLVVIIIGVTAAMAVPRYKSSFEYMKLKSGALDVAATVEHAQSRAVLEECMVRMTVEDEGARLVVDKDQRDASDVDFVTLTHDLPVGVTIGVIDFDDPLLGRRDYVTFRPNGQADRCTITVAGRTEETYRVYVESGFGRTRIELVESDESSLLTVRDIGS